MFRISAGLASITLTVLLAGHALGLFPDRDAAVAEGRKALCEAEAVHYALSARKGDPGVGRASLLALLQRNPDLLSAGVRGADGRLLVEAGDHRRHWGPAARPESTATHMQASLRLPDGGEAVLELCFRGGPTGLARLLTSPDLLLTAFVTACAFGGTYLYLRSVLRHADLNQNRVVPDRVRATLNTVVEGVLILDRKRRIALANDAFAATLGQPAEELTGRPVDELPASDRGPSGFGSTGR